MSSPRGRLTQPPQTARAAAVWALAVGLAVFAVQALVRGGDLLFAAAVSLPCAAVSFALHVWGPRKRRAEEAAPRAARYSASAPPPGKPD